MKSNYLRKCTALLVVFFMATGFGAHTLLAQENARPAYGGTSDVDTASHLNNTSQPEGELQEAPAPPPPETESAMPGSDVTPGDEGEETAPAPPSFTPAPPEEAPFLDSRPEAGNTYAAAPAPMAVAVMDGAILGTDYEYVYLDDERTQIDETAITVLTGKGLDVALSGTDALNRIYMGRDITYGTAFFTHANKSGGTLYGYRPEDPGTPRTLYWNGLDVACPQWERVSSFTLEDITIYCVSQYTLLWGGPNTDLTARNVTYYGPQLAYEGRHYTLDNLVMYHQQTTVGTVTGIATEELTQQCTTVTIQNEVSVTSQAISVLGLFDLRTGAGLTVAPGATLAIDAANRPLFSIVNPTLTIGAGAGLQANVNSIGMIITDLSVEQAATLDLTVSLGAQDILPVSGSFAVNNAALVRLRHSSGAVGIGNGIHYTGASSARLAATTVEIDSAYNGMVADNPANTTTIEADSFTLNSRGGYGIYFTAGALDATMNNMSINSYFSGMYTTRPTTLTIAGTGLIRPSAVSSSGVTCLGSTLTMGGSGRLTVDTSAYTGGNALVVAGGGSLTAEGPGELFILASGQGVYLDPTAGSSATFSGHQRLEITAAAYCLYAAGPNASFAFNTPQLAVLEAGAPSIFFAYNSTTSLGFTTTALNRWGSNIGTGAIPTTPPDGLWNLAEGQMDIQGTGTGTNSSYNITNTSALPKAGTDPVDTDLTSDTLNMGNTPLLVFGELSVSLNTLYSESPAITGATAPGAALTGIATAQAAQQIFTGTAEETGAFALSILPYVLDVGTTARVTARSDLLRANGEAAVQSSSGFGLTFTAYPTTCDFGTHNAGAPAAYWVAPPPGLAIHVQDNRLRRGPWHITAAAPGPLQAQMGDTTYEINNALAKRGSGGVAEPLGTAPIVVYQSQGETAGETVVYLQDIIGLYLQPGDGIAGTSYSADIQWALVAA